MLLLLSKPGLRSKNKKVTLPVLCSEKKHCFFLFCTQDSLQNVFLQENQWASWRAKMVSSSSWCKKNLRPMNNQIRYKVQRGWTWASENVKKPKRYIYCSLKNLLTFFSTSLNHLIFDHVFFFHLCCLSGWEKMLPMDARPRLLPHTG